MKVVSYSRRNVVVAGVLVLALVMVAVPFYTHGDYTVIQTVHETERERIYNMKVVSYSRRNVVVAGVLVLALVIVAVSFYTQGEKSDDGDIINQDRKKRSPDTECTCGEGLRVKRHCSDTEDVECQKCPTGTYSNTVDNFMNSCQYCTFVYCPQYSVQVSPCTAESDIFCECKQGYGQLFNRGDRGFSCMSSFATVKHDRTTEIVETTDDPNQNSGGTVNPIAWLILVTTFYNIWYII